MWMSSGIGPMKTFSPFATGTRWPGGEALAADVRAVGAAAVLEEELDRPALTICACFEDTCGWLTTIWLSGVRPIEMTFDCELVEVAARR